MQISMSSTALGTCRRMLENLSHILDVGEACALARNIDPLILTGDRLAPDMFPLRRQVQVACDVAKNGLARIAGVEAPRFEDTETSFAELRERIAKTLAFLESVPTALIDGTEEKAVTFPAGKDTTRTLAGFEYLSSWVLPNLYFHVTMAYAILRHNGVDVGKGDYLRGREARA